MKKILANALWIFTMTTFAASGCNSPDKVGDSTSNTGDAFKASERLSPTRDEVSNAPKSAPVEAELSEDSALDYNAGVAINAAAPAPIPGRVGVMGKMGRGKRSRASGQFAMANHTPAVAPSTSEHYVDHGVNDMTDTSDDHLSTFAVDVDTASYAIARRKIIEGQTPPTSSVRVEEFVNYFKYDYEGPTGKTPFAAHMDMAPSPFAKGKHLLRVGVQAKKLSIQERKNANLVFLVDVSGSMSSADKLPLAKRAMRVLVDNLKDGDTVSLVTYAGNTRVVLEPTGIEHKAQILSALEDLSSGGSTAMSSGMTLAYDLAMKTMKSDSISRVIVLSDGDANVGNTSHDRILKAIEGNVKQGVTMSTIGFGMGNYQDHRMEQLANKGNGNYYYVDGISQARRIFQEQLGGTLEVVAKDVKIQVDFDEDAVESYRLVGYENRDIADNDFRNDKVDAGEIGAGHSVTALYEVILKKSDAVPVTVRIRHMKPRGTKATEKSFAFDLKNSYESFDGAPEDFRFATAVMGAAEILRKSDYAGNLRFDKVLTIAGNASSKHSEERQEFLQVMKKAAKGWKPAG